MLNKHINHDLSLLNTWLLASKISLNAKKIEIVIFRHKQKHITKHLNFRLSGQKLQLTTSVKYLGIIMDEHLTWEKHMLSLIPKLSRANGILARIRHCTSMNTTFNVYFALFYSHLNYASLVWGQSSTELRTKLAALQNKTLKIISFKTNMII